MISLFRPLFVIASATLLAACATDRSFGASPDIEITDLTELPPPSGEIFYTRIRCRYLDEATCRCSDYSRRSELVPNCIHLSRDNARDLTWLPSTCAYRLIFEGKPLFDWHPLISGTAETVHAAGVSVKGWTVPDWPKEYGGGGRERVFRSNCRDPA